MESHVVAPWTRYSTCEVVLLSVVQVTVAPETVVPETVSPEITGSAVVTVKARVSPTGS